MSAGTIYVELDIDASKFTAKERQILQSASGMVKRIEDNWKLLGGKSDEMYNAMRKSAENAYKNITSQHGISTQARIRAQMLYSQEIKRIDDEMTGKMIGNVSRLNIGWLTMIKGAVVFRVAMAAIHGLWESTFGMMGKGLEYLAKIETAQLGIGAAFMTSGKYIDITTGKALEGSEALKAAQMDSKQIIDELRAANLQTIATLDQLIVAYQQALPVAMARGFDRRMVKEYTLAMVQAAGAIGLSMDELGEETRSMLTGSISPRFSRIATVLGLRNEDIAQYKDNAKGLFDFLMSKLKAYQVAGIEAQTTWAGLWSNIKDITFMAAGEAMTPVFEGVKQSLIEITNRIIIFDEKTKQIKWNPEFVETMNTLKSAFTTIVADVRRLVMLIDLVGAGMALVGKAATFGMSKFFNDMFKTFENRLKENEKALMDMAMKQEGYKPATKETPGAISVEGLMYYDKVLWYVKETAKETNYLANDTKKATDEYKNLLKQWQETLRTLNQKIESSGLNDLSKKIIDIRYDAEKLIEKFKTIPGAVNKIKEARDIQEAQAILDYTHKMEDERIKMQEKADEEYRKIVTESQNWSVSEHQRAINNIISSETAKNERLAELWRTGLITYEQMLAGVAANASATADATYRNQRKELEDSIKFYSEIEGYEGEHYREMLNWIELERKARSELYGMEAANDWANQAIRNAGIASMKMSESYGNVRKSIDDMTSGIGRYFAELKGNQSYIDAYKNLWMDAYKTIKGYAADYVNAVHDGFNRMGDAITDFVMTGKSSFRDFANSVIADMVRIATQQAIIQPLMQAVMPFFPKYAHGAAFEGGVQTFGSGGVFTQPTIFPMASGAGMMVENWKPEAVMPLTRLPGGDLGVRASGSDKPQIIKVEIMEPPGQPLKVARQTQRVDPQETIVTLWLDAAQRNRYGLRDLLQGT